MIVDTYGRVRIDEKRMFVHVGGKRHRLSLTQFKIMRALIAAQGGVLSRGELCKAVGVTGEQTIDVHVLRIRRTIGPRTIMTMNGVGYQAAP